MGRAGELGDVAATSGALSDIGKAAPVSPKTSTTSKWMCPRRIRYPVVVPSGRQLLSRSRRRLSRHRVLSNPRRRAPPHHTRRRHRALDGLSLRSSRTSRRQCSKWPSGPRRCPQSPGGHLPSPNPQIGEPIPAGRPAVDGPPLERRQAP